MQRYDTVAINATITPEGFIRDAPVVGRTGILRYKNADGSDRFEYRPPEEAFNADSLKSLLGKPITIGHKAMVDKNNAAAVQPVGSVLSEGRQDGETIRADIVIYNLDTDARELSCGYRLDLDEKPGTTPQGEHYDAVQRNIRYNHVAIVPKGRAGVARLNMDGEQDFPDNVTDDRKDENIMDKMTKIRLDGGLEYDAAPEVGVYVEKLRADIAELNKQITDAKKDNDTLQAKFDALTADLDKEKAERKTDAEENKKNFDAAVKDRVSLLAVAAKHKIEKADEMSDKDIKIAVIKSVRGDNFNLDGKSEDYIAAAFDMAKDDTKTHEDKMAVQRANVNNRDNADEHEDEYNEDAALKKLMDDEAKAYLKEVK